MTIESTIQRLTNDGEVVVQFLVDTVQGNIYNATVGHRLKSAEWLTAFGELVPEDALPQSATIRPRPKDKPKKDKPGELDKKPPVTEKQILHFDIARLIKNETRDGETIIQFLIRVVAKIEKPGEHFTPAARIRAARELLIRGYGSCIPGINRILSGKTEELDSYISKTIREYTGYGADPVRFLIDVMENEIPEIEPKSKDTFNFNERLSQSVNKKRRPKGFTASQRVWVACELLRRAYDIRTDHITYADIQAYWQSQTPTQKIDDDYNATFDIDKTGVTPQQVEAEIAQMRASDAAKAAAANTPDGNAKSAADEKPAANASTSNGNANSSAADKKPAAKSNSAQDNQVSAEKPATKTVTGNASAATRADRRRQQRAAKKRSNPADTANNADATGNHANDAPNPTDVDAPANDNNPDASDVDPKPAAANVDAPTSNPKPCLTRAERRRIKRKNRKRPPKTRSP